MAFMVELGRKINICVALATCSLRFYIFFNQAFNLSEHTQKSLQKSPPTPLKGEVLSSVSRRWGTSSPSCDEYIKPKKVAELPHRIANHPT